MRLINVLYKLFFLIPNLQSLGVAGKIFNKIVSLTFYHFLNWYIPSNYRKSHARYTLNSPRDSNYRFIVSLTTIPSRLPTIWLTIESLLRQESKPDRIILWIDEENRHIDLNKELLTLTKCGLEIRYCINIRSHSKYYHTMQLFPKAFVITVDDDIFYPTNMISNLLALNNKFPDSISSNLVHRVRFDAKGEVLPYVKWDLNYMKILKPSSSLLQLGIGGVIYPPQLLPAKTFDINLLKSVSLGSDDVWLKMMTVIGDLKVVSNLTFNKYFITIKGSQGTSLLHENTFKGRKDKIIKLVMDEFNLTQEKFQ